MSKKRHIEKKNVVSNEIKDKFYNHRFFPYTVTAIFFIVCGWGILHHEMWRDEYQAWMLATNSNSLSELFYNLRYDGHPALWHCLLFFTSKIFVGAGAMQILHLVIATANVWMINKYAPFNWYQKVMASFGYYTFYEYAVISRNYGLGLFFVLLFCVLYRHRFKNILWLGVVIFFMANTQSFSFMIGIACLLFLIMELFFFKKQLQIQNPFTFKTFMALGIALAGILLAYKQISPPEDGGFFDKSMYTKGWNSEYAELSISRLANAYIAIPKTNTVDSWNSNIIFEQTAASNGMLGALMLFVGVFCFITTKRALMFYIVGTGGLLLFFYLTSYNFLLARYVGHLYIVFFASFWLSALLPDAGRQIVSESISQLSKKTAPYIFTFILILQMWGGLIAYKHDLANPFSNAHDAVQYIKKNNLDKSQIVGTWDYIASSLAGALNKPIYYPEKADTGTFILWNKARLKPLQFTDVTNACITYFDKDKKDVLLILNNKLTMQQDGKTVAVQQGDLGNGYYFHFIKSFDKPCICKDEVYHIYTINKTK